MAEKVNPDEIDINLVESFARLWRRKKQILIITACFFAAGIFVALFAPERYKSECVFVPQVSQGMSAGRYSSLAALAGISLDMGSSDGQINPKVYPYILKHPGFQKELMYTEAHFQQSEQPITLYEYLTNDEYHKFNLFEFVGKYTIGLPMLIAHKMAPKPTDVEAQVAAMLGGSTSSMPVYTLTKEEDRVARTLRKRIKLDVDTKKGYLTLTVTMPEAVAAAEVCDATFDLIKKYVSEFKKDKSKANLEFIQSQVEIARTEYEEKQEAYANFMDSNKGIFSARAAVEQQRLKAECELKQQLYSELAKNELTARVKVEENTVNYTELSPASVPLKRAKPKRAQTVVLWTIIGFLGACCYVGANEKYRAWKNAQ